MARARLRGAVRGKLDAAGRLIEADPELEALQRDAGGTIGQQLAVPQLAAIARLARDLGTSVSRPAIAASAHEDIDLWVSVRPADGDVLELSLEQWRGRPATGPRLEQLVASTDSDVGNALAPLEWSADDELRIIALSGDFARLVGLDPEAAAGMPLTRLVQLEENDDGDMPLIAALAARHGFSRQPARLRSGGGTSLLLSGEVVTSANGGFAGFRGRAQTIGDAGAASAPPPQAEPAPALDESLDEVLRQPLRRILESAGRIIDRADGPLRGDYANYGNDIAAAARHLDSVIEGMRGSERGGAPSFEAQSVDLSALAAEAVVMVEPAAESRDVHFELQDHPPLYAAAEERAVIQILVNLMGNAVRYSDPGAEVHILFAKTEGTVSVSVRDQGRGIDPTDQERIFERFERADAGAAGTGLGLAISRRLARAMGGDIGIESRPGFGSTFTLILPGA